MPKIVIGDFKNEKYYIIKLIFFTFYFPLSVILCFLKVLANKYPFATLRCYVCIYLNFNIAGVDTAYLLWMTFSYFLSSCTNRKIPS